MFKLIFYGFLILLAVILLVAFFSTSYFAQFGANPKYDRLDKIKTLSLWNGTKLQNPKEFGEEYMAPMTDILKESFFGKQIRTPEIKIPVVSLTKDSFSTSTEDFRVTWLGHATTLIEVGGTKILTDPVFSDRASPSSVIGPRRFFDPPIALADLPQIDAVVISHDHYDHLDMESIKSLARRPLKFIVPLGIGAHLESWGVAPSSIIELSWWESYPMVRQGLEFICTPSRHFSGRLSPDGNQTLWASWVIKSESKKIYFSGDTGFFEGFAEIGEKFGPFDLTLIKIGAYDKFWLSIHLDPEQAIECHKLVNGKLFLPIHWGTFNLANHAWNEPVERLITAAEKNSLKIVIPKPGQIVNVFSPPLVAPWWKVAN